MDVSFLSKTGVLLQPSFFKTLSLITIGQNTLLLKDCCVLICLCYLAARSPKHSGQLWSLLLSWHPQENWDLSGVMKPLFHPLENGASQESASWGSDPFPASTTFHGDSLRFGQCVELTQQAKCFKTCACVSLGPNVQKLFALHSCLTCAFHLRPWLVICLFPHFPPNKTVIYLFWTFPRALNWHYDAVLSRGQKSNYYYSM